MSAIEQGKTTRFAHFRCTRPSLARMELYVSFWKTSRQFLEKNPMGYTMQGFGLKEHFKQTAVVPI